MMTIQDHKEIAKIIDKYTDDACSFHCIIEKDLFIHALANYFEKTFNDNCKILLKTGMIESYKPFDKDIFFKDCGLKK